MAPTCCLVRGVVSRTGLHLALSQQLLPVAAAALAVSGPSFLYVLPNSPTPTAITLDPPVGHGYCLGLLLLGCTKHWSHQCTGMHQQAEATRPKDWFLGLFGAMAQVHKAWDSEGSRARSKRNVRPPGSKVPKRKTRAGYLHRQQNAGLSQDSLSQGVKLLGRLGRKSRSLSAGETCRLLTHLWWAVPTFCGPWSWAPCFRVPQRLGVSKLLYPILELLGFEQTSWLWSAFSDSRNISDNGFFFCS